MNGYFKFLKLITFPFYIFVLAIYNVLKSFYNIFIRSVFFEHVITRKEKLAFRLFIWISITFLVVFVLFTLFGMVFPIFNLLKLYIEYYFLVLLSLLLKFLPVLLLDLGIIIYEDFFGEKKTELYRLSKAKRNEFRFKAISDNKIFVGTTIDSKKKPVYLTNDMRALHTLAIGTTGSGKTEGFIKPWVLQDILRGYGAVIVDPKGDIKLFNEIYSYHKVFNKHDQNFYYLNLGDPEHSNTYNPIFRGTATELKDRIMNMVSWGSERYYRIQSEMYLFNLLLAIESLNKKITIEDLYLLFTNPHALSRLIEMIKNQVLVIELQTMLENYSVFRKECQSLVSNLGMLSKGPLSSVVNTYNPDIDLLEAYKNNDVLFFSLPTNLLTDTARAFGRMLLMDLQSTSGYIHLYNIQRRFYPVFIDEFGEFAIDDFISWLNKARSSGYSIHIAFQEAADLEKIDRTFMKQVIGNTSIKVVFCVHDNETAETLAKILGTVTVKKETERIDKTIFNQSEGMVGSVREVEEFKVHPNVIKNGLRQGQCLIWGKIPQFYYHLLNADYIEVDYPLVNFEVRHKDKEFVRKEDCLRVKDWFDEAPVEIMNFVGVKDDESVRDDVKKAVSYSGVVEEVWRGNSDDVLDYIETNELNNLHAEVDLNKNGIEDEEENK